MNMVLIDLNLTPPEEQEGNISDGNIPDHEVGHVDQQGDINMEQGKHKLSKQFL